MGLKYRNPLIPIPNSLHPFLFVVVVVVVVIPQHLDIYLDVVVENPNARLPLLITLDQRSLFFQAAKDVGKVPVSALFSVRAVCCPGRLDFLLGIRISEFEF